MTDPSPDGDRPAPAVRVPIRFTRTMAALGRISGMSPAGSWIELDDDELRFRMGVMARGTVPRAHLRRARPLEWARWAGYGVRWYWLRHWGLIGSNQGVVELEIDPPTRVRMILPVRIRRLAVSVDDPDGLLRLLDLPRLHDDS